MTGIIYVKQKYTGKEVNIMRVLIGMFAFVIGLTTLAMATVITPIASGDRIHIESSSYTEYSPGGSVIGGKSSYIKEFFYATGEYTIQESYGSLHGDRIATDTVIVSEKDNQGNVTQYQDNYHYAGSHLISGERYGTSTKTDTETGHKTTTSIYGTGTVKDGQLLFMSTTSDISLYDKDGKQIGTGTSTTYYHYEYVNGAWINADGPGQGYKAITSSSEQTVGNTTIKTDSWKSIQVDSNGMTIGMTGGSTSTETSKDPVGGGEQTYPLDSTSEVYAYHKLFGWYLLKSESASNGDVTTNSNVDVPSTVSSRYSRNYEPTTESEPSPVDVTSANDLFDILAPGSKTPSNVDFWQGVWNQYGKEQTVSMFNDILNNADSYFGEFGHNYDAMVQASAEKQGFVTNITTRSDRQNLTGNVP